MIEAYNLFPTCVFSMKSFLTMDQSKDIESYILNNVDDLKLKSHTAIEGKGMSSHNFGVNFLDDIKDNVSSCKNIKHEIFKVMKEYENSTGLLINDISNSWFNIQENGSELLEHSHPLSIVSGSIYINVDQDSSSLHFSNPNPYNNFQEISHYTEYTFRNYWFKPEIGQLLLFPSWLRHGSNREVNNTPNRIVVGFNTK